jgi:pyridinium-3,5-biscarboxylic acid mononucleotide sulfurtransferase
VSARRGGIADGRVASDAILGAMQNPETELMRKQAELLERLAHVESVIVALSGGADSAYLAWAAHRALGTKALAVTAISESFSVHDRKQLEIFLRTTRVAHEFVRTNELADVRYAANNGDRCYFCKDELFGVLDELAAARGFAAMAYGINADDTRDFRPGHRAAREHGVLAPLLECGLTKTEIRELSRLAGLPTWDRPASACLSSRIPFGTRVTPENLRQVERAEAELRALGFRQLRVRHHGELARVEIAWEELSRAQDPKVAKMIARRVRNAGYARVEIDPQGYRQGSLNAGLRKSAAAAASVSNFPAPVELGAERLRILK